MPSPILRTLSLAIASAMAYPIASAADQTLTQGGFTGLGITPNAHLLGWGRAEFTYDNQLPGIVRDPSGHNYVLGFGLLPNIEIAGRLAANSPQDANCFTVGCGARDLSASVKVGIGLDTAGRWRIAGGATDIGGAVTYFRTYYGVLTFNEGPWEASAGLAKRSGVGIGGSKSPLDGPFAAASWQPVPWARAQVEYTDSNAWGGVRLFTPDTWLPEGWKGHVGVNQRLTGTNLTERTWFTAGISIPLYKVPSLPKSSPAAALPALRGTQRPLPAYEARTPAPGASAPAPAPSLPAPAPSATDAQLAALGAALQAQRLEDIWVGRMPDGSVAVRANNATYNWNSLDGLGAALSAVASTLGEQRTVYRLVLTQRQLPLVAVTGQADCLRQWIQTDAAPCAAGELSTPGTIALDQLHAGAEWIVRRTSPSWQTLRVALSPVLNTNVGSEFGVLDYALGANIGLLQPLWSGAQAEARFDVPLANSSDFEPNGVFGGRRVRSRLERLSFTQSMRLPLERWIAPGNDLAVAHWGLAAVTTQASVGRFDGRFDGLHGALRWEPGQGRHRVSAEGGIFRNADFGEPGEVGARTPKPLLANYRYHFQPTRTYVEGTAGNFMNNDAGFQLGVRQWFSDVALHVYYRRSKMKNDQARQFIGLELSVPIGPRRDMAPDWVQLTGTPRFTHGVETTVRESGSNTVRLGFGEFPPVPTLGAVFNSDRAGLLYFEDNVRRIRDAARQVVSSQLFPK